MKAPVRILIAAAVAIAAVAVIAMKPPKPSKTPAVPAREETTGQTALPRLLDLGAGKCVPCKAMKPILDELMADHAHQFDTRFIDVWLDPEQGRAHGVRLIPTQIFLDEKGGELWRHEGFMSKEDIFKAWHNLGYDFPLAADET